MTLRLSKNLPLALALFISINIAGSCTGATTPTRVKTSYQSSGENFPNPERGFYHSVYPSSEANPGSPLQLSDLQKQRSENISTVRRYYLLEAFRNKPIPQYFLDMISSDFRTARQAGIKLIVRFTYNWSDGVGGPKDRDAPANIIFSHIEQLKPILKDNYDVLAYMEAGFVGYWGEWHNSTNNLLEAWNSLNVTEDAKKIVLKLLSVLPPERMVAIRYPMQKKQIFNNYEPISSSQAFNGSNLARTGHHNDAFRGEVDDAGTYGNTNNSAIVEQEKAWASLDTKYVIQGGEPAWASDPPERDDCPGALTDLARMHWSGMNINWPFAEAVYQGWKEQGCMEEIKRRLGYRFRLINSYLSDRVKPASTFSMSFKVTNDGWASPYNPRLLEVVLRHRQTGKEYYLSVPEAVRMWMPGETRTIKIEGGIPANMLSGEYQVLLNLPDPAPKLYNRPEYSIRFANQNVWEASTGYNSLLRSIIIDPGAAGNSYLGERFFKLR